MGKRDRQISGDDLSKDISEENNLAQSNPEQLEEMIKIWEELNGEMREPLF